MKIDIHKNIELASLYYDYPSTICAGCDADTCKKCLYFPVVKEKINTAIKKYAPIKALLQFSNENLPILVTEAGIIMLDKF